MNAKTLRNFCLLYFFGSLDVSGDEGLWQSEGPTVKVLYIDAWTFRITEDSQGNVTQIQSTLKVTNDADKTDERHVNEQHVNVYTHRYVALPGRVDAHLLMADYLYNAECRAKSLGLGSISPSSNYPVGLRLLALKDLGHAQHVLRSLYRG